MGRDACRRNGTKTALVLTAEERRALEALLSPLELTPEVRRAQALLWLDAGHSPQTVAKRLGVSRQTIYNWITGFRRRCHRPDMRVRLADRPRSGRPRTLPGVIDPVIATAVKRAPHEFGYRASVWNTSLLTRYLREVHHVVVTRASVGAALRRLRIRPRVVALGVHEKEELEQHARHAACPKEARRAQALLWLDAGVSVRQVARWSQASRQAVYSWLAHFQARRTQRERSCPRACAGE